MRESLPLLALLSACNQQLVRDAAISYELHTAFTNISECLQSTNAAQLEWTHGGWQHTADADIFSQGLQLPPDTNVNPKEVHDCFTEKDLADNHSALIPQIGSNCELTSTLFPEKESSHWIYEAWMCCPNNRNFDWNDLLASLICDPS